MCPVHGVELLASKAEIAYGLFGFPDDIAESRAVGFPCANRTYYGGCCVLVNGPWYASTTYCPVCRQNEKAYWDAQPS